MTTMSDQALLITWVVGAVVTAWIVARLQWLNDGYRNAYLEDYLAPVVAGVLWPLVAAVGAVAGVLWLFTQTAKPGRVKLPRPRRDRLQQRIDELEAELGMRDQP